MHAKFLFVGVNLLLTVFASPVDIEARACIGPTVNAATIALLKEFEGFVERPEPDPIGLPTVGYGHLCQTKGCAEVPYDFPLTEETATKLMMSDLKSRQQAVTLKTGDNVVLNANQYGALVSFTYNMGNGNFAESDLLSRLNAGEDEGTVIAEELPKWKYAGGRVFNGLVRRRKAEIALAQTATTEKALPVGCT